MFKYGQKVIIRDGSKLDGSVGLVYRVTDGTVLVLLDKEVLWPVAEDALERVGVQVTGTIIP